MALPQHLDGKAFAEQEAWFLEALEQEPLPVEELVAVVASFADMGAKDRCEGCGDLLLDALAGTDHPRGVDAVEARYLIPPPVEGLRKRVVRALRGIYAGRCAAAYVDSVGLDTDLPLPECLRRLRVLIGLSPDTFCHDKTWGFGVVRRIDDFYKKVAIDFTSKAGHQMSFAYAAETLELVGADHLLAIRHAEAERLAQMVKEEPDEVVRIALRSYGPLNAIELQEIMTANVIEESAWKSFWDAARKRLKRDPLVDMPAKRKDPIVLMSQEKAYDDAWFARLEQEREPREIQLLVEEVADAVGLSSITAAQRAIVANRLSFAVMASENDRPELAVRILMLAVRLGFDEDNADGAIDLVRLTEMLSVGKTFLQACTRLATRDVEGFLGLVDRFTEKGATPRLAAALSGLPENALGVALDLLAARDETAVVSDWVRDGFTARTLDAEVLTFLCSRPELLASWGLGDVGELLQQCVEVLGLPDNSQRARGQRTLLKQWEARGWLEDRLDELTGKERSTLMARIRSHRGLDETFKRSVMGRMIKAHPDLAEVAAVETRTRSEEPKARFTSWRSFSERQEQLRVLVEVSIPENSKEIGVARSYGDLRENFEYQAAKDHQALLMRRKAELEQALSQVRGTDFTGVPTDAVGMGTGAEIERPDGSRVQYWILGEWDRDEALGIISSESALAKRLAGARAGDEVVLPDDTESNPSRIVGVYGLTDEIRSWIGAGAG